MDTFDAVYMDILYYWSNSNISWNVKSPSVGKADHVIGVISFLVLCGSTTCTLEAWELPTSLLWVPIVLVCFFYQEIKRIIAKYFID